MVVRGVLWADLREHLEFVSSGCRRVLAEELRLDLDRLDRRWKAAVSVQFSGRAVTKASWVTS